MKQITVITLVLILGLTTGCSKSKQAELTPEGSSDEELFQLGEEHIKKNPEKGRLYLRQVIDSFPKSFYAQRAKLAISDSYFRQGDEGSMIIAASEYREFIQLYPYSPSAAFAQYQIGLTYYKKVLKPGRDQSKTHQALAEFRIVINKYPLSEEAEQAREKIQECEERLAEHSMSIAELYYKRNAYRASISRLTEILTEYPNYTRMDKVYYLIADSYYRSTLVEESVPYFRKLISDYPNSKYARKAVKRMDEIEKSQNKKDEEVP
ncbi:MAG: outer membrane protein assembly factor BamD [Candidatus Aminicenantes bacterium]|nr:outer membrane protein assembly factor BamD [Candidatus Aminicenantes bacterium]